MRVDKLEERAMHDSLAETTKPPVNLIDMKPTREVYNGPSLFDRRGG